MTGISKARVMYGCIYFNIDQCSIGEYHDSGTNGRATANAGSCQRGDRGQKLDAKPASDFAR